MVLPIHVQQIYEEGLYHPSVTQSITGSLFGSANFSTADVLQQNASKAAGFICTCGEFYDNPCRVEIRAVSTCHPAPLKHVVNVLGVGSAEELPVCAAHIVALSEDLLPWCSTANTLCFLL